MEYYDYHIYCFAAASAQHNVVCKSMLSILDGLLKNSPKCTAYGNQKGYFGYAQYTMPDVSVECEDAEGDFHLSIAAEALSPSNMSGDTYNAIFLQKLKRYKRHGVKKIVLADIEHRRITLLDRNKNYEAETYSVEESFDICSSRVNVRDRFNEFDLEKAHRSDKASGRE